VLLGAHEAGGAIAIVLFALWCARPPRSKPLAA
jgi:hypothetical protein